MRSSRRGILLSVAAVAATVGWNVSAAVGQVACGATVTTKAVMTGDLTCITDPGFSIGAGGSVDMAGHFLAGCSGCDGIILSGPGAKLSNGFIDMTGATSRGVVLAGGTHKVENIAIQGADIGLDSSSGTNKIKNVTADGAVTGFNIVGDKNALSRCHSGSADDYNFRVVGDNNNLTENTSSNLDPGAVGAGFFIDGDGNKLARNNSANDRGPLGAFHVNGNGNKLGLNSVTESASAGLWVIGNDNKVSKSVTNDSADVGLVIAGDTNKLSKNASNDNGNAGISVNGDGNNVNASNTSNNGTDGILLIAGNANSFKSNVTMRNGDSGVDVNAGAVGEFSKTVALGNGSFDLQDDNPNCGGNVWAKSVVGTSDVNGVGAPNCIQP